jgi:DNA-directed RNA polymerase specialized sigma24 family protein
LHRESDWERLLAEQITKNSRLFFSLAHGLVRNSKTAEEVWQHALLKACEHRDRLLNAEALQGWLRKVVKNEGLRIRRRGRVERQATAPGYLPARKAEEPPHHHVDLDDAVAVALEKLPDEVCAVVVLRLMEGLNGRGECLQDARSGGRAPARASGRLAAACR